MNTQPRDGAFVVIYSGELENWQDMKFLLGSNANDNLFELLGGGFDIADVTPDVAACREVLEETVGSLKFDLKDLTYFCHMVQKVPRLGDGEKGHVFYFFVKNGGYENFNSSSEHNVLSWHKLSDLLEKGETEYRTSTLRIIIRFMKYLSDKNFQFGILKDRVTFLDYTF